MRCIKHGIVHVHVNDGGTVIDLTTGYAYRFIHTVLFNQPQKLTAAGHIAPLAHVYEIARRRHCQRLKAGKQHLALSPGYSARFMARCRSGYRRYVGRSGTAASACYVDEASCQHRLYHLRHIGRSLVILSHFIRQSSIGIYNHRIRYRSERLYILAHAVGAETAVEPYSKRFGMRYGGDKGLRSLTGKSASRLSKRHRHNDRHTASDSLHGPTCAPQCGLGIQAVVRSLHEQKIDTALYESATLHKIGIGENVPCHSFTTVIKTLRQSKRLARRPDTTGDPTPFSPIIRHPAVCDLACHQSGTAV